MLHVFIASTVMGTPVTVKLVLPVLYNDVGISLPALVGALLCAPIAWEIAKAITGRTAG